jgi:hypothetical protein
MAETITIQQVATRWHMTPSAVLRLVKRQGVAPDVVLVPRKKGRPSSSITIIECKMIEDRVLKEQQDQLERQFALLRKRTQELERKKQHLQRRLETDKKLEKIQGKLAAGSTKRRQP